jgi:hypothetical protein
MDPSHRDDSDSSYSAPKGKSVDPDDDDPDDNISYVSSSSNGAKKPAATTNGNKGTKATSTPKATKEKCQCKGCPGLPPTNLRPLVKCGIESCEKQLHHICYEKMMDGGKTARTIEEDLSFCTLGHHDKYTKGKKENNPNYLTWKNDGADGPNDQKCSEFYLVDWLASEERYMRWRDPPGALTKLKVCEEIAEMIKNKGCKKPLDADCVYNKITHIESKMRQCHDQYAGTKTGNGLKESDPMAYEDKVSECLYATTFEQPCHVTVLYLLLNNLVMSLSFIFHFRSKGFAHTTLT